MVKEKNMNTYIKRAFIIAIISLAGYGAFHYSHTWLDLISYSVVGIIFSFIFREFISIISDAKAEVNSYEERRKAKYLQQIKPTLSSTEKLYIESKKDLPYKLLKEDFTKFREKINTKR